MNEHIGMSGQRAKDGSRADISANFAPNMWRYVWFNLRGIYLINFKRVKISLVLIAVAIWAYSYGRTIESYVALGIALIPVWLIFRDYRLLNATMFKDDSRLFKNGLLTYAEVESEDPTDLIHIATITKGGKPYLYGLRRVQYLHFPDKYKSAGTPIPVSSAFAHCDRPHTWASYEPRIIPFGTSDESAIQMCLEEALQPCETSGLNYADILSLYRNKGNPLPEYDQVLICDAQGTLLEIRKMDGYKIESVEFVENE